MLETIRTYAIDRLEQTGEAEEIRRRHADHYVALAEEEAPYLTGETPKWWLDRQEDEHDNHRAANDWLESSGHTQEVLRLAGALTEFWQFRGHLAEGARRLEAALPSFETSVIFGGSARTSAGWRGRSPSVGELCSQLKSSAASRC